MFKTEDYFGLKKKGNYENSSIAMFNLAEARNKKYKNLDNSYYAKQLKNIQEFKKNKGKSVNFRRNMVLRQKAANYKNEIDRIHGEIQQSITKNLTHDLLDKRKSELEEMIKNIN